MPHISKMAMLFAMAGPETPGDPPTGPPSGLSFSVYGANYWRVHWTNGDPASYSRVYYGPENSDFETAIFLGNELPGATSHDTVLDAGDDYRFFVTHYRNGEETAPVEKNTNLPDA